MPVGLENASPNFEDIIDAALEIPVAAFDADVCRDVAALEPHCLALSKKESDIRILHFLSFLIFGKIWT